MNPRFAAPNSPAQKPKTAEELQHKSDRKTLRRDRAIVQQEVVGTLRRSSATTAEIEAAQHAIASRVLLPLKLTADAEGRKLLATLADGLTGNGEVGLLGVASAIESIAAAKEISQSALDTLTPAIIDRLDKLV